MEIKYLSLLSSHPTYKDQGSEYIKRQQGVSLDDILHLENIFNKDQQFPQALRELLYIAGNYCYVLDYAIYQTQQTMQSNARYWLIEWDKTIGRPFFVIDVYNGGEQFLFVYLDEGNDDPQVYNAFLPGLSGDISTWINAVNSPTLSAFINNRLTKLLDGFNPF